MQTFLANGILPGTGGGIPESPILQLMISLCLGCHGKGDRTEPFSLQGW